MERVLRKFRAIKPSYNPRKNGKTPYIEAYNIPSQS